CLVVASYSDERVHIFQIPWPERDAPRGPGVNVEQRLECCSATIGITSDIRGDGPRAACRYLHCEGVAQTGPTLGAVRHLLSRFTSPKFNLGCCPVQEWGDECYPGSCALLQPLLCCAQCIVPLA